MESEYCLHESKQRRKRENWKQETNKKTKKKQKKKRKRKVSLSDRVRTPLEPGRCEEFSLLDNELYITLLSLSYLLMGPANRLLKKIKTKEK